MDETELWWTCNVCNYQEIISEGEEFNDFTGQDCPFCRNGNFMGCEVYKNGEKIGEFPKGE